MGRPPEAIPPTTTRAPTSRVQARTLRSSPRTGRLLRRALLIGGVALVLLVLDLAWATLSTARHLSAARIDLEAGVRSNEGTSGRRRRASKRRGCRVGGGALRRHPSVALCVCPRRRRSCRGDRRAGRRRGTHRHVRRSLVQAARSTGWTARVSRASRPPATWISRSSPRRPRTRSGDAAAVRRAEAVGRHRRLRPGRPSARRSTPRGRRSTTERASGRPTISSTCCRACSAAVGRDDTSWPFRTLRPTGYRRVPGVLRRAPADDGRSMSMLKATAGVGSCDPSARRGRAPLRTVRVQGYLHAANFSRTSRRPPAS